MIRKQKTLVITIFFSQINHLRAWIILTVIINIIKYCWIKGNAQMQLLKININD